MIITKEFIESGGTNGIGFTSQQFKLLGLNSNPKRGWKDRIVGNEISDADAEKFLALRGSKAKNQATKQKSVFPPRRAGLRELVIDLRDHYLLMMDPNHRYVLIERIVSDLRQVICNADDTEQDNGLDREFQEMFGKGNS